MKAMLRFLLLATLLLLPAASFAQVVIEKATAGLDGYIRGERWIPAVFQLRNGPTPLQGSIELMRGGATCRRSLDLAPYARKQVEMLFYVSASYEPFRCRILDAAGNVILERPIQTTMLNFQDNLLLVVSEEEYSHQFLNATVNPWGGKTFVAYLKGSQMYDQWLAYSTADGIALGSISPGEISPSAWKALMIRIAADGILILSPSTSTQALRDPLLRPYLPTINSEMDHLASGNFLEAAWKGQSAQPFPAFSFPAQTILPSDRQQKLLEEPQGGTLAVASPYYKGSIIIFAFDYTRMPEQAQPVFPRYWNSLVYPVTGAPPQFGRPFRRRLEDNPHVQRFLYEIPGLRLPDVTWFALFFFVYVIVIGPAQYLLLTRLNRKELVWTTFPAIVIFFTIIPLSYSKYLHSSEGKITHVQVVEQFPSLGLQVIYQAYGTIMPQSGTFSFQAVPENSYLTKTGRSTVTGLPEPYTFSLDPPYALVNERVKDWTFRIFDGITACPIDQPVEVSVFRDGVTVHGTARNATPHTIHDSFYVYDMLHSAPLGTIAPGQSASFDLDLTRQAAVPFAEYQLRDMLDLYCLSYSDPHFLFGTIDDKPGEIRINGAGRPTALRRYLAVYSDIKP